MVCDGWGTRWCGGGVARGTQVLVTCFFAFFYHQQPHTSLRAEGPCLRDVVVCVCAGGGGAVCAECSRTGTPSALLPPHSVPASVLNLTLHPALI